MSELLMRAADGSKGRIYIDGKPYDADENGNYAIPASDQSKVKDAGVLASADAVETQDLPTDPAVGDQAYDVLEDQFLVSMKHMHSLLGRPWTPLMPQFVLSPAEVAIIEAQGWTYPGMMIFVLGNFDGAMMYRNWDNTGWLYSHGNAADPADMSH